MWVGVSVVGLAMIPVVHGCLDGFRKTTWKWHTELSKSGPLSKETAHYVWGHALLVWRASLCLSVAVMVAAWHWQYSRWGVALGVAAFCVLVGLRVLCMGRRRIRDSRRCGGWGPNSVGD
jgi:hypothetical protein